MVNCCLLNRSQDAPLSPLHASRLHKLHSFPLFSALLTHQATLLCEACGEWREECQQGTKCSPSPQPSRNQRREGRGSAEGCGERSAAVSVKNKNNKIKKISIKPHPNTTAKPNNRLILIS